MSTLYRGLIVTVTILVSLLLLLGWVHHKGYLSGQAKADEYYLPLMVAAEKARAEAEARTRELEERADQITQAVESEHVEKEAALAARADDLNKRLVVLLRQHPSCPASGGELPATAGSAAEPDGGTQSDQRNQRFATSISRVGGACEHDATALADAQRWYSQQRAARGVN